MTSAFSIYGQGLKLDSKESVKIYEDQILNSNIREFTASGNSIGVEAAKELAGYLKSQHNIRYVNLSDIVTGRTKDEVPEVLKYFCEALEDKKGLMYINFSSNAISHSGAEVIAKYLSKATSIREINLQNCGLGWVGGTIILQALIDAKQNQKEGENSGITFIDMGRNRLENESCSLLSKFVDVYSSTLSEIYLFQNGIREKGISDLSIGLSKCSELKVLDLEDNTIISGALDLAKALKDLNKLEYINLNDCYLTSKGACHIFEALKESEKKNLRVLLFQYNYINPTELDVLKDSLIKLGSLSRINLNGNNFDESTVEFIRLKDEILNISGCMIDPITDMECEYTESDEEHSGSDSLDDLTEELREGLDL